MNRLPPMMRVALLLSRFLLSAWFGAAVLFVIIGVREVTHPGFDSLIRDQLALLRFPAYYACGFPLLGGALASLVLCLACGLRKPAVYAACGLTLIALGLMAYDYPCIYSPLARSISPPGQARAAEFRTLHVWSETVNAIEVGCVLAAALAVCGVDSSVRPSPSQEPIRTEAPS